MLKDVYKRQDKKLRVQMRQDLLSLQRRLGITTIFVTHDQEEAMTTADRMAVLEDVYKRQVLYDLLGRDDEHDKRDESVRQFMKRYHVDVNQARRVHRAALSLFDTMMPEGAERTELRAALGWAADLHEVGLSIAHNAYHKHTAYVLSLIHL